MERNLMTGTYIRNNEYFEFNFKTNISAFDKMLFVNSVVDTIVDESRYNFVVRDLIFDFSIIRMFTDVDTSFVNDKDEDGNVINPIIHIERFLAETNIVSIVKVNMIYGLLDELNNAVNQSIEYRTGIHTNPLNDALASLINTLERKVNEIDLNGMAELAKVFSGMTGEFTQESISENIVKAYMNSNDAKK